LFESKGLSTTIEMSFEYETNGLLITSENPFLIRIFFSLISFSVTIFVLFFEDILIFWAWILSYPIALATSSEISLLFLMSCR
jgi:hypothetical protein